MFDLWIWKRRIKEELRGIKYLIGDKGMTTLKTARLAYEISRVVYNPFYLIEIACKIIL
tara:strand:+ start:470 stop:646 length:177 start_codon:yes stop_codon:yes gene_type:complete